MFFLLKIEVLSLAKKKAVSKERLQSILKQRERKKRRSKERGNTMGLLTTYLIYNALKKNSSRRSRSWSPPPRAVLPPRATKDQIGIIFDLIDIEKKGVITLEQLKILENFGHLNVIIFKRFANEKGELLRASFINDVASYAYLSAFVAQKLIRGIPRWYVGFSPAAVSEMSRYELFEASKKHKLGLDACTTSVELRKELVKLASSVQPSGWFEWISVAIFG